MSEAGAPKETHVVSCSHCSTPVKALQIGGYDYYDEFAGEPIGYMLLQCPRCNGAMLAQYSFFETEANKYEAADPKVIYPLPYKELGYEVPIFVRQSYEEAVKCLAGNTLIASALMCRRTLEAVVQELLPKSEVPLAAGLSELRANGLIDPQLMEWATALRVSGNKAAHDVAGRVTKQDALDLIAFTHALIEYVFTYKQKFEEFMKRVKAREAKPASRDVVEEF